MSTDVSCAKYGLVKLKNMSMLHVLTRHSIISHYTLHSSQNLRGGVAGVDGETEGIHEEIIYVTFPKVNGSMGLSIVAAKVSTKSGWMTKHMYSLHDPVLLLV